jgi:hypothetical protein
MRSGVTIREPLQVALNVLQLLATGAVGFVLNRVSFAKASPAFRQSLLDMENRLRASGGSSSIWPVKWQGFVNERIPVPGSPSESRDLAARTVTSADAPVLSFPKVNVDLTPQSKANSPKAAETPWWMPQAARADSDLKQECASNRIQAPQLPDWFRNKDSDGSGDLNQRANTDVPAQAPVASAESRMERLRGLFANVGLADLHRNRAPLSETVQEIPDQNEAPAVHEKSEAESSVSTPGEPQSAPESKPAVVLPREFVPVKESVQDDDIRILPAKRGQYGLR